MGQEPLNLILIATAVLSWLGIQRPQQRENWLLQPYRVVHKREWYRLVSHAFVHADFAHMAINLFVLWQFGAAVQMKLNVSPGLPWIPLPGVYNFLMLYAGGLFAATIPAMMRHSQNPHYRSLGASGAVSAVMIAYVLHFPAAKLLLFFIIPMPAFLAGALFFIYEYQMDKQGRGGIAHDAHLWGGLYGLLFTLVSDREVVPRFVGTIGDYFGF